jgi:hypothetical protein
MFAGAQLYCSLDTPNAKYPLILQFLLPFILSAFGECVGLRRVGWTEALTVARKYMEMFCIKRANCDIRVE